MAKRSSGTLLTGIMLDRERGPLHRQLYDALRRAVLDGRLAPGERLPATRTLADEVGVSRNTVLVAFRQLLAEGYVEGKIGAGTFVARTLPDELLRAGGRPLPKHPPAPKERDDSAPRLSSRAPALAALYACLPRDVVESASPDRGGPPGRAFVPGRPALDRFPFDLWGRLVSRRARDLTPAHLNYQHPAGYPPLREAIARYLDAARGVRCTPEQVIIVGGAQQAHTLVASTLLDPGDAVWVEDPGYFGARGALAAAGARPVPVPVDAEGLDVAAGVACAPDARLAIVTPAHQFPLGVTLSLPRRLALLEWAASAGAYILEDDYDSEYRYAGRPLAALQSLDRAGRVIYAGTFSKVLFPALRLGYLVVPPALMEPLRIARFFSDYHSAYLEQAALADFLAEGHFTRHIRRMRGLYAERQAVLVEAAARELDGLLEVPPADAGMHLLGWLPEGVSDADAAARAQELGVIAMPLSRMRAEGASTAGQRGALTLGYAAVAPPEIVAGVGRLARALAGK